MSVENLASSDAFRCGLESFGRRYYFEAHELLEAVWLRLPPASAERHLLRGLIQLSNAGLKARMGRANAARRILTLSRTALAEAFLHGHAALMGLSAADLRRFENQVALERADYYGA